MKNTTISNFRKNIMGTISFTARFPGMKKEREFTVYPVHNHSSVETLRVQSDNRWAEIEVASGNGEVTSSASGHHNSMLLALHKIQGKSKGFMLDAESLAELKEKVIGTSGVVGNSICVTDNTGAARIG